MNTLSFIFPYTIDESWGSLEFAIIDNAYGHS